jgi:hypothetical protein
MSTLRVNNITDTSGGSGSLSVPGAAKAWVNFNGTGTVAIRAALNVSSITDNGTGDYTMNFTSALSDANYNAVSSCSEDASTTRGRVVNAPFQAAPTTSALRIGTTDSATTLTDLQYIHVAIHR